MVSPQNEPAFYFPVQDGRYEVKPDLHRLSADFGNGQVDAKVFQIDKTFADYRHNKLAARSESIKKYICLAGSSQAFPVINRFMLETLCNDYPQYFLFDPTRRLLECQLTGEKLQFNSDFELDIEQNRHPLKNTYLNGWDALAMQVQEDIAVMKIDPQGQATLIALHLCAPNHWAAEDKIGKDFIEIHRPVPGMQRINQRSKAINLAILNKGPYVRFAWGLATDRRLNHHPVAPANTPAATWHGRQFSLSDPQLYLRVERQTLTGLSHSGLALFTIRTYFYAVNQLARPYRQQLMEAVSSMDEPATEYKGLAHDKSAILQWLATISR
ncbi:MAG: DUF3445 domain-containing protein [Thioalkalispiraceae bacterium]|jgi:hypothetical protein